MTGFGVNYISPIWTGTKSFSNTYLHFVLGVEQSNRFSEELAKTVRGTKNTETKKYEGGKGLKEFKTSVKDAWTKSKTVVEGKSFWGTIHKSFFQDMPNEFKAAKRLARMTGKNSKFIGSTFKILGKRMPFIANVVMLGMEVPNLYRAFTQGGFGEGLKETGKTAVKFGGFAAGAAIGSAVGSFIPVVGTFIGGLVGGMIGGWLAEKVVGKSFTEKQEEAEAAAAAQNTQQQVQTEQPEQTQNTQTTNNTNNANAYNQAAYNPMAYSNPFYKPNYMDEDFMALNAGLVR